MPYSIPTLTMVYQDFRWRYTSRWCCHCPTPLVRYKEHSSARHFQLKLPETSWIQRKHTETLCGCAVISLCCITLEPLDGKFSLQAHIIEQHKSYRMVVELWELVQVNLNAPFFARGTFCVRLWIVCTKTFTAELMDVSGLWDLNEKKAEELLYLLVFDCSPRSEGWPGMKK